MENKSIKYSLLLYHGTNDISSNNIIEEGFKVQETRNDHWLGKGIYFFREDLEQAFVWASSRYKNCEETNEVMVLQTKVEVNDNNFLNLDSRGGMLVLKRFLNELKILLKRSQFKKNGNPAKLRHFIMSLLPKEYYIIQRTFPAEKSVFDSIKIFREMELNLNGVQVCIRNEMVITNDVSVARRESLQKYFV